VTARETRLQRAEQAAAYMTARRPPTLQEAIQALRIDRAGDPDEQFRAACATVDRLSDRDRAQLRALIQEEASRRGLSLPDASARQ